MPTSPDAPVPLRILIVDDDPASRRLLVHSIERHYPRILQCESGAETIQSLQSSGPALVVLDYQMPDLNGAEVCERIRSFADSEIAHSPIIMLTGHSDAEHELECLRAGADDFVTKPVNMAVLRARIDTHLRLHSLRKQLLEQNTELEKWRSRHEEDLEAARLTQQAILPHRLPVLQGWDFAATYLPLMRIGGDIYDWVKPTDNSLLVWMSDATGHGASAALLTTLSKLLFRHAAAETSEPAGIMDYIEREFKAVFKGQSFMTAACLSFSSGRITFCGAGQPPLLIAHCSAPIESLRSSRPPIGLNEAGGSIQETRDLLPGDAILLYTDGLYEIHNPDGQRLEPEGLADLIPAPSAASDWLSAIIRKTTAYADSTPFPDDIAAVAAIWE